MFGLLQGWAATAGGIFGGWKTGAVAHAKKYKKHIRHLLDPDSSGKERRVSHKQFRTLIGFFSGKLLESKDSLQKEKDKKAHQNGERIGMGVKF